MYDELIKRLHRYTENCVAYKLDADFADAVQQAVDAIEELERENERLHDDLGKAIRELAKQPRWIPVTERLPLLNTPVLATDGIEVDISWMYGVPPRWITSYTAIDEDKLTHWMPLPQTPKDGES